ncbi:MAG: MltA domain-containing protein [Alphaproteobacteria bacterium]|nr:MltA domain-containing protein [Alphaproteobacteria bacterium]
MLLLSACAETPPGPAKLSLKPVAFSDLPGWPQDKPAEALPALTRSCDALKGKAPDTSMDIAGKTGDWQTACEALANMPIKNDETARIFFEARFQPYAAESSDKSEGIFTGYYEASLRGAKAPDATYTTPLYAKPRDLITADLGEFRAEWKGQRLTGKVEDSKLRPYDDRATIEKNSLKDRADILAWVDDPVDAFFLAIQGSGRVQLADGNTLRIGYDAANGRAYVPIGRVLADMGALEKPVTMQSIRAWLAAHPERAQEIMNANPSYVFFRALNGDGPVGAQGVALTPERSLAVDPAFVPLGIPLWLDTQDGKGAPFQKLMVAQDTGGAIKGPVRGDVFWGYGPNAEAQAGPMQSKGRYFLLLPKP